MRRAVICLALLALLVTASVSAAPPTTRFQVMPIGDSIATPGATPPGSTAYDLGIGWTSNPAQAMPLGDEDEEGVVDATTTLVIGPDYSLIRIVEAQLSVLNAQTFYDVRATDIDYFGIALGIPSAGESVTPSTPNGCALSDSVQGIEQLTGLRLGSTICVTESGRFLWVSLIGEWDDPRSPDATPEQFSTATSGLIEVILGLPITPQGSPTPAAARITATTGSADQSVFGAVPTVRGFPLSNDGDVATGCWTETQRTTDGVQDMQWSQAPALVLDLGQIYTAELTTNYGTMTWQLLPGASETAVNNFVCLSRAGYYDGALFHRIVDDFVIQGGDPTGTGTGGPGYTIPDDVPVGNYSVGMVTMARTSAPDSTGSQFFINIVDNTRAFGPNPTYINFARVIAGQDTVNVIASVERVLGADGAISSPVIPVILQSVKIYEGGVPPQ